MKKGKLLETIISYFNTEESSTDKFIDVKGMDEKIYRIEGDEIVVDATVQEVTEDGLVDLTEDITIELEDGRKIVVVDGKVSEIIEVEDDNNNDDTTIVDPSIEDFKKMRKEFSQLNSKFSDISAWLELPVGVWIIGDYEYTVEEKYDEEWDYTYNVITQLIKVENIEPSDEEMKAVQNFEKLTNDYKELKEKYEALGKIASEKELDLTQNFAKDDSKVIKKGRLRQMMEINK